MKALIAIIILALLAGGGYWLYTQGASSPTNVVNDPFGNANTNTNTSNNTGTDTNTGTNTAIGANTAAVKEFTFTNEGMKFNPTSFTVKKGDRVKVTYRNNGGTHDFRIDGYNVTTQATPGYSVASLVSGAVPPIDPATLPDVNGDTISRNAFTAEAGVVAWSSRPVSLFAHYVHSYRHPNLEELLFSGPATAGI